MKLTVRWKKQKRASALLLALCLLLGVTPRLPARAAAGEPVVVGYYGGWASYQGYSPDRLPADRLTHINYAFADIDPSTATLRLTAPENDRNNFRKLRELKRSHPGLRTLLSVGGWDYSANFSDAAATRQSRESFAQSCLDFILEHGFDGVDLDWEYPVSGGAGGAAGRPQDRQNFTLLLRAIRDKLDAQGRRDGRRYLLTIAGGADSGYLRKIEPEKVAGLVDYIFLMAYDYHGPWDRYADLNAPLYTPQEASPQYKGSVASSVQAYRNANVPAEKLVLGMPFYGRLYQGVSQTNYGLYSAFSSSRSVSYREVKSTFLKDPSYARLRHSRAQVPYLSGNSAFLSYDDPQSVAAKAITARDLGLLGFGAWELSQDAGTDLLDSALNAWRSPLPFSDVPPGAWYYDAVAELWERGAMNGTSELTFSPNSSLTRGMFTQVLYNLAGRPPAGSGAFLDVPAGAWYADAVNWAAASGLAGGYGSGRFGPEDPVTREQLAVMLHRYAASQGHSTAGSGSLQGFSDSARVSRWAREAVSWAVGQELLRGKGGGLLDPAGSAARAEVAAVFQRYLNRFPE